MEQHIGFTLGTTECTVPIVKVREIINMPSVTKLPQAPPYIEGVTNLRGAVIPVVNLKRLVNLDGAGNGAAKVIVLASGRMTFGVVVDAITGVIHIGEGDIEPPQGFLNGTAEQIEGIARVDDRLVVLLDTKRLFPEDDPALFDDVVDVSEPAGDGTVEVVKTVQSIAGEMRIKEVCDAKQFLEKRGICAKDPRYVLFDDVLRFIEAIGDGDIDKADRAITSITQKGQGDLFMEVGKVARKLHDSVRHFNEAIDPRIRGMVTTDMPKAVDKLQLVIEKTEEAANKTMGIVEGHILRMDDLAANLRRITGPEDAVSYLRNYKNQLEDDLTEIITTQAFQDITGQAIKKVTELVGELEDELVGLVTSFGVKVEQSACVGAAEERVSQSDVDDLLKDFGF